MTIIQNQSIRFQPGRYRAALGYLLIYTICCCLQCAWPSLQGVGIALDNKTAVLAASTKIINWQMVGFIIGGILWEHLETKGRLSVLFGSIALYSVANFFTGFVQSVPNMHCKIYYRHWSGGWTQGGITLSKVSWCRKKKGYQHITGCGNRIIWCSSCILRSNLQTTTGVLCYKIGGGFSYDTPCC